MNTILYAGRNVAILLASWLFLVQVVSGAPTRGGGRAIIAGKAGNAFVRYPEGTIHQYPQGRQNVAEGDAFTEGQRLETEEGGHLCIVLTPGAVLCLNSDSAVHLNRLREMPEGLPSKEQELVRTIDVSMEKGAMLFYGGQPSPNNHFRIELSDGVVETNGANFECARRDGFWKVTVQDGDVLLRTGDEKYPIYAGQTGSLGLVDGKLQVRVAETTSDEQMRIKEYELCDSLYPYLNPLVFRLDGVDVDGVADLIGDSAGLTLLGDPTAWTDVSPSQPVRPLIRSGEVSRGKPWNKGRLISREKIWSWYHEVGTMKGVNYIPRYAVNAIEMWASGSFDADLINEELGWAHDVGYNSLRVPLSFTVWQENPKEYVKRVEKFLELADRNHLRTALVLMDDSRRSVRAPKAGPQPEPVTGVYNSQWVPSPGPEYVLNQNRWAEVEKYVRGMIRPFKKDHRVLFWDVYHTPGNDNLWDKSLPLLESAFKWARDEGATQPLTAGPWTEYASPMSVRIMELSDFVSLQSFDGVKGVENKLEILSQFGRPIVCTDWLKRQSGSTFSDILPVFSEYGIGWFSRGLVEGRTQLYLPDDRLVPDGKPEVWQQDVLKSDGSAYDEEEVRQIRAFNFK